MTWEFKRVPRLCSGFICELFDYVFITTVFSRGWFLKLCTYELLSIGSNPVETCSNSWAWRREQTLTPQDSLALWPRDR